MNAKLTFETAYIYWKASAQEIEDILTQHADDLVLSPEVQQILLQLGRKVRWAKAEADARCKEMGKEVEA